eukprot:111253-Prymnesium_polylepis.1
MGTGSALPHVLTARNEKSPGVREASDAPHRMGWMDCGARGRDCRCAGETARAGQLCGPPCQALGVRIATVPSWSAQGRRDARTAHTLILPTVGVLATGVRAGSGTVREVGAHACSCGTACLFVRDVCADTAAPCGAREPRT